MSGKKLVELRKERYLSRDELAERAKMTRSNLQRIEQAEATSVTPRTLRKLSDGFGVLPAELERLIAPDGQPGDAKRSRVLSDLRTLIESGAIAPATVLETVEEASRSGRAAAKAEEKSKRKGK